MADRVELRNESNPPEYRRLWAKIDESGALEIEGEDVGPGTAPVSDTGDYEYAKTFGPEMIPRLLELLGAPPDSDVISVLSLHWTGDRSYELERRINESGIPFEFWCWP